MRRSPFLVFVSLLLVFVAGCGNSAVHITDSDQEADSVPTVSIRANSEIFQDEPSLFEEADLIVVAETRTRFEDREHVLNYTERDEARSDLPPALSGFCTKTPITVWKVLKQPNADTIREQEGLEILEPAALIKQEQGIQKVTTENYREIESGSKYILYLKANTNGDYSVINMNNGKFDLENDSAQTKRLEENEEEQEIHERLKQSAKQRFAEEIADLNI